MIRTLSTIGAVVIATTLITATSTWAQEEEEELGWQNVAELTLVWTAGNSETNTLGFRNTLNWKSERARFRFRGGGIRTESTIETRFAIGDSTDFTIREESDSEVTAESYLLGSRYDREITDRLFWFGGASWERNTFAGIDNRTTLNGGVGNIWFDEETFGFRTDYGLTVTFQDDVVENPATDDTFIGYRFSWEYWRELTANSRFESVLVADDNGEETSDFRTDLINSLAVSMSERVALKVSHRILFDNEPSFEEIPLLPAIGSPQTGTVFAELKNVDTITTVALVLSF